jgi:prepilin-type N-terminal cleavage/methylation domain-containing protein
MTSKGAMTSPSDIPSRSAEWLGPARGFTLLELVLALALVLLLALLAIGSFQGVTEESRMQASADRLGGLLRACRAEAALSARRLRLTFDESGARFTVLIERDPLSSPGVFDPYDVWWTRQGQLAGAVRVAVCELTGGDADVGVMMGPAQDPSQGKPVLSGVTFYPDGSSDSARILLTSDDPDRPWTWEICLNGVDGTVSMRPVDTSEEGQQASR